MQDKIQYCSIDVSWIKRLASFFELIKNKKEEQYFHPHPFNRAKAEEVCHYKGHDLYFIQTNENEICGYGMLRGWDEGYSVPSLGIITHPAYRGKGLGERFMNFLHDQARHKGAKQIRLTVYSVNVGAIALYKKMGYTFSDLKKGQFLGYAKL